jgi:hypothetical protein
LAAAQIFHRGGAPRRPAGRSVSPEAFSAFLAFFLIFGVFSFFWIFGQRAFPRESPGKPREKLRKEEKNQTFPIPLVWARPAPRGFRVFIIFFRSIRTMSGTIWNFPRQL